MPGAQQAPTPAATTAPAGEANTPTPPAAAAPAAMTPPWGSDAEFNPERAWNLIQNVRGENDQLKQKIAAAQPAIDAIEQKRREEQGELATAREDLTRATEREAGWRAQAISAAAKSQAGDRFIDADAALALIGDVSGFVDGDKIDTAKITAALDKLAADKPHLVKQPVPQGFTPNRGQGQSGTVPTSLDAQIKAAQDRGDVMGSIALKQQQLYQNR
jgi:hypothetical protein